jgi:hypothetical protein
MKSCAAFCFALLAVTSSGSRGQGLDRWESAKAQVEELVRQGKCPEAWQLGWRWAKSGNPQARVDVGMAVYFDFVVPGGLGQDAASLRRHKHTFIVHALLNLDNATAAPGASELRQEFVRSRVLTGGSNHPFYDCLAQIDRRACTAALVKDGFVADFEDYARELDAVAGLPGATPTTCGQAKR